MSSKVVLNYNYFLRRKKERKILYISKLSFQLINILFLYVSHWLQILSVNFPNGLIKSVCACARVFRACMVLCVCVLGTRHTYTVTSRESTHNKASFSHKQACLQRWCVDCRALLGTMNDEPSIKHIWVCQHLTTAAHNKTSSLRVFFFFLLFIYFISLFVQSASLQPLGHLIGFIMIHAFLRPFIGL